MNDNEKRKERDIEREREGKADLTEGILNKKDKPNLAKTFNQNSFYSLKST